MRPEGRPPLRCTVQQAAGRGPPWGLPREALDTLVGAQPGRPSSCRRRGPGAHGRASTRPGGPEALGARWGCPDEPAGLSGNTGQTAVQPQPLRQDSGRQSTGSGAHPGRGSHVPLAPLWNGGTGRLSHRPGCKFNGILCVRRRAVCSHIVEVSGRSSLLA